MTTSYDSPDYYKSLPAEIKYLGVKWTKEKGESDLYIGYLDDGRFEMRTWTFGPKVHQARIDVLYPKTRSEFVKHTGGRIRILPADHPRSRRQAVRAMVEWVKRYKRDGPLPMREEWIRAFRWFGSLYRTRFDFLNQVFIVGGNGYDWLDGHVVQHEQRGWLEARRRWYSHRKQMSELDAVMRRTDELLREADDLLGRGLPDLPPLPKRPAWDRIAPEPDDGAPLVKALLRTTTMLFEVPDDGKQPWVTAAYEYAKAMRARQDPALGADVIEKNTKALTDLLADLEVRFPYLKEPVPAGTCVWTRRRHSFGPVTWGHECVFCGVRKDQV